MATTPPSDARLQALTDDLTDIEQYRLLSDDRRQRILSILHERGRPMDLDDLAADLASTTADPSGDQESATRRARITLHHKELPMMAELGVLSYEAESGRIQL